MLVDANILLYSIDEDSPFHVRASEWLTAALNGPRRVGLPWLSLWAFMRIATNPRASAHPLSPQEAWSYVDSWLASPAAWIPEFGRGHGDILRELMVTLDLRAGLISDAVLAAMCIEQGLAVVSADSDFARFPELTWINPLSS